MKTIILIFSLLFSLVTLANTPSFSASNKTIVLHKGTEQFCIVLQANPSTGYSWLLKQYNKNLVQPITSQFIPANSKLIGASGTQKWFFKVNPNAYKVPSTGTITFIYARPWDLSDNATTTQFNIVMY